MELDEYQRIANETDQQPAGDETGQDSRALLIPILGLAGEVGELVSEYKKRIRDKESYALFEERIAEELGDILWYLANVSSKFGFSLSDIATRNLLKTRSRWIVEPEGSTDRTLYDASFPPSEQIPRHMDVLINEEGSSKVRMLMDGIQIGDTLRDNRYEDDGYRFHDVFHLAYACVLGWSPTLRALLKRKRKSNPSVDEVEDGGRARVIEEGISAMVFSYAERNKFLDGAQGVNYELLRTIKHMTAHLEVRSRSEGDWEKAIMLGFELWREVRRCGQGRLHADLEKGTLELIS